MVYMDAAYSYGLYAPGDNIPFDANVDIGLTDFREKLAVARLAPSAAADQKYGEALAALDALREDIQAVRRYKPMLQASGPPAAPPAPALFVEPAPPAPNMLMIWNMQKFGPATNMPVLTFFAVDNPIPSNLTEAERANAKVEAIWKRELIARYKAAHPQAKVVELPGAKHGVFDSNPDDVLREMEAFLHSR